MSSSHTILVTGGAGFLGTHLCQKLLANNHNVICLDNFYTGRKENIEPLLKNANFTFIEHDVCEPFDRKVDMIYHLACPASPPHYQKDPIYTMKISLLGAMNVLSLAQQYQARVLLASTSEVYGDPTVHPQKENYWGHVNPNGIRACYDEGKRASETLFMDYHRQHQLDIRIARIFNTYGPYMDPNDGRVISNFIMQSLNEVPITIYGDGSQTRSFCYAEDTVNGLIKLMETPNVHQPVNIGNPTERTIKEMAELIQAQIKSSSKIIHHSLPQDDPMQRCPDISLAKKLINWAPTMPLEEGLVHTVDYFKTYI